MASQRELQRARDRIASLVALAQEPGTSYASQKAALTGIRRELQRAGAKKAAVEDLVSISSRTYADPAFRAAYLVNAASRMAESEQPHTQAVLSELDNYRKHVRAEGQRQFGMQRLQGAVNAYGPLVGWYAVLDDRTTPECREMNGKNFFPSDPPAAGLPGVTHVNCRCRPGPPHQQSASTSEEKALSLVSSTPKAMSRGEGMELSVLNTSPRKNWVENKGGLPSYVVRIAVHLIAKGFSKSHAIATAINVVKKMKSTGDLNWPGRQRVNPGSRAEAGGAVARWSAMKASDTREGNRIEMARDEGNGYAVGHLPKFRSTASPKYFRPGAAPGTISSPDPTARTPRSGSLKTQRGGSTPSGGMPKRIGVGSSSATNRGPSDTTKVMVRRVREQMKVGRSPTALQTNSLGPNSDAGRVKHAMGLGGQRNVPYSLTTARTNGLKRDSAKGVGHAAPPKSAAPHWSVSLALPKYGVPAKTSNTVRAAKILKSIRKWGKPKKMKLIKTWKPTHLSMTHEERLELALSATKVRRAFGSPAGNKLAGVMYPPKSAQVGGSAARVGTPPPKGNGQVSRRPKKAKRPSMNRMIKPGSAPSAASKRMQVK